MLGLLWWLECILARSDPSMVPQILGNPGVSSNTTVHGDALQSQHSAKGLHKADKGGGPTPIVLGPQATYHTLYTIHHLTVGHVEAKKLTLFQERFATLAREEESSRLSDSLVPWLQDWKRLRPPSSTNRKSSSSSTIAYAFSDVRTPISV